MSKNIFTLETAISRTISSYHYSLIGHLFFYFILLGVNNAFALDTRQNRFLYVYKLKLRNSKKSCKNMFVINIVEGKNIKIFLSVFKLTKQK